MSGYQTLLERLTDYTVPENKAGETQAESLKTGVQYYQARAAVAVLTVNCRSLPPKFQRGVHISGHVYHAQLEELDLVRINISSSFTESLVHITQTNQSQIDRHRISCPATSPALNTTRATTPSARYKSPQDWRKLSVSFLSCSPRPLSLTPCLSLSS